MAAAMPVMAALGISLSEPTSASRTIGRSFAGGMYFLVPKLGSATEMSQCLRYEYTTGW